jgi:threonine dehydrogenase-like Zn-dependent dehydrogenase
MRVLIWAGGDGVEITTRAAPVPQAGDVRVRVAAAGVCATDLHIIAGRFPQVAAPKVLGHEIAGVVDAVGAGVEPGWVGRRVVVDPIVGCRACAFCGEGRPWLCGAGGEMGTTGGDGGWAEAIAVPAANLHRIPDALSFQAAVLVEPLNCVLAAFTRAQPRPREGVLVFGSGPAGLLFVMVGKRMGCAPIVVVGGGDDRLALARRLGADHAWPYTDPRVDDRIRATIGPEGAAIVVEAAGAAVQKAFRHVRRGGRVVLYGLSGSDTPNIASDAVVTNDLSLVTGIGDTRLWPEAVAVATDEATGLESLVTHRLPFDRAREALALAADPSEAVKVLFSPGGETT